MPMTLTPARRRRSRGSAGRPAAAWGRTGRRGPARPARRPCRCRSRRPSRGRVARRVDAPGRGRGDEQPADRAERRHHQAAAIGQLADRDLPPHLEADDEEEQHHQAVVDPVPQVLGVVPVADADAELRVPQRRVRVRPGRVGPDQRDDRRREQQARAMPASVTRYARSGAATCPSRMRRFGRVCSPAPAAASIVLSGLALNGPPDGSRSRSRGRRAVLTLVRAAH